MSTLQVVGAALVALPFVALFGYIWREDGFLAALGLFAGTALLVAVFGFGIALLTGDLR